MSPEWNKFESRSLANFAKLKSEAESRRAEKAARSDGVLSRIREENDAVRFALGLDRKGFESALKNDHYQEIMGIALKDNLTWNDAEKRFLGVEEKLTERRGSLLGEIIKSLKKPSRRRTEPSDRSGLTKSDSTRVKLYSNDNKGIRHKKGRSKTAISEDARVYGHISDLGISKNDYIGGFMSPDGSTSDQEEELW